MINYDIYQLKDDPSLHSIRFANTRFMNTHNIPIDAGNYDKVYSGNVDNESAAANSHFLRPAGPHFPASQGHIKRSALEIGRARGALPC